MFCKNCGKEVNDDWAMCPNCGTALKDTVDSKKSIKKTKKKSKKIWIILGVIVVGILGLCMLSEDDTNELDIIAKLEAFTSVYEDEINEKYYFLPENEEWALTYSTGNEWVSFENPTVIECFTEGLGADCFAEDSVSDFGFAYDLSDNEARIYFDTDIEDGHLTIVSYNLTDKEYTLMIDGEKWEPTDEFIDFVEGYALSDTIETNVATFVDTLQKNELTIDDLLCVKYDTLKSQFVPEEETNNEVEPTEAEDVSENVDVEESDSEVVESNSGNTDSNAWKQAYLDYLNANGNADYGYSLDYIDEDDIPELVVDYMITAEGTHILTYKDGQIIDTPVGETVIYRMKENSICVSGGRMDVCYDIIYEIIDGVPTEKARGEYGILDFENIRYDASGNIIDQYTWNGQSVSEYDYTANVEKYNMQVSENVYSAANGYLYDIIEVLSHPMDITIINPYLNDNGYMSLLNQYIILFDGIEGDKIHFNVTYNGSIVGSASATIVDSTTAEFKNANSELLIKFNVDYKKLEVEGYMNTIDLTGSYEGCWG